MARIPDKAEHRRRFAALETAERRAIVRAVNKGRPVERRKHAPLAVGLARQQQRFWRYAWLVGPLIGLVQLSAGWQVAVANAVMGTVFLGMISAFWSLRARRSEQANLALLGKGGNSGGSDRRGARDGADRRDRVSGRGPRGRSRRRARG